MLGKERKEGKEKAPHHRTGACSRETDRQTDAETRQTEIEKENVAVVSFVGHGGSFPPPVWRLQPVTFAASLLSAHSKRDGTRPEVRFDALRRRVNCRCKLSLAARLANSAGTPPAGGSDQLHLFVVWAGKQMLYLFRGQKFSNLRN